MNKSWIYNQFFFKIIKFLLNIGNHWIKSNYISTSRGYFGKSIQALRHHLGKSMSVKLPLTYRFVYIWPRVKFVYSESWQYSFQYSTPSGLSSICWPSTRVPWLSPLAKKQIIGLLQLAITWYKIRHAGGQAHYYSHTGTLKQRDLNQWSLRCFCFDVQVRE